jgi:hypothetical protein
MSTAGPTPSQTALPGARLHLLLPVLHTPEDL